MSAAEAAVVDMETGGDDGSVRDYRPALPIRELEVTTTNGARITINDEEWERSIRNGKVCSSIPSAELAKRFVIFYMECTGTTSLNVSIPANVPQSTRDILTTSQRMILVRMALCETPDPLWTGAATIWFTALKLAASRQMLAADGIFVYPVGEDWIEHMRVVRGVSLNQKLSIIDPVTEQVQVEMAVTDVAPAAAAVDSEPDKPNREVPLESKDVSGRMHAP